MTLMLTFDVEDWYHANFDNLDLSGYVNSDSNFPQNVRRLIELCARQNTVSTCFVLGCMAEKYPDAIKELHKAGHEIASHGYGHRQVFRMTPEEFREDLRRSCDILENLTGEKIEGFRAPSWSVRTENLPWYYEVLAEEGLSYSSSVYPAKTYLYGIPDFPKHPHFPVVEGRACRILEIPVPIFGYSKFKTGYSGGFYLRILPKFLITRLLDRALKEGGAPFVYLHPREVDPEQPRLPLNFLNNLVHYWGISGCEKKLESVVSHYSGKFILCRDFVAGHAKVNV